MKKYLKEGKFKSITKMLKNYIEDTTNVPITIDKDRIISRNLKQPYPLSKGLLSRQKSNYDKNQFKHNGDIDRDHVLNKHRLKK
jgi:hypothetical protein